ncbi:MAG: YabN family protein [Candidatus Melainabacteria bacterium]|jgi:MazG family protein
MNLKPIEELIKTTARLRAPNGCPWDREQTHASLKKYLIEEAYEVLEAIDKNSTADLLEELGDVLFQVCLHAQIEAEIGGFDFAQVAEKINQKMISRHPHVFSDNANIIDTADKVVDQWERIKAKEKADKEGEESLSPFSNIPSALPSLARAVKVLKKASKLECRLDFNENLLVDNSNNYDFSDEEQLGAVLLKISNQAKQQKLDPEESLRKAVAKIQKEFENQIASKTPINK